MRGSTLLLAATLTTGLLTALPGTATAAPSGPASDFNGDGYRDVAIGAFAAQVGSVPNAGAVVVLYGSRSGVSAAKKTVITQNSVGVPGTARDGDRFGSSLAAGDLNADGCADLVVGAPFESVGDRDGVGSATVIWGGKSGLTGGSVLPSPSGLTEWGGYSSGVATGDFDGDGRTDVTITGQSRTGLYRGPFARNGKPVSLTGVDELGSTYEVIAGNLNGDRAAERVYPFAVDGDEGGDIRYFSHDPGDESHPGSDYAQTRLPGADGHQGAVGDINGDGYGDLVLGDHEDPRSAKKAGHKGGQITVWYGGANGPAPAQKPTVVHQDTAGVPGTDESYDAFGQSVRLTDLDKDGKADLVVGAGGENGYGAVTVLYGSAADLTTKGTTTYTQNTAGIPDTEEKSDRFGGRTSLLDHSGDRCAELSVYAPDENSGDGAVWSLRATPTGPAPTGAASFGPSSTGITTPGTPGDGSPLGG
ncbi:hypothetical protein [Streptomyces sp. NPDC050804]|uniref:hypothetical protein n=1 Tax=Streptomyces sp. NPDC050804 TaxID=3154745 RepID=UPI003416734D